MSFPIQLAVIISSLSPSRPSILFGLLYASQRPHLGFDSRISTQKLNIQTNFKDKQTNKFPIV